VDPNNPRVENRMNRERMEELKNVYSKGLLEDTLPF
jgi:hypothetical protein